MSKYITHFQTEAEYQTALPTLDLPNVSLVDELGEVHYHRALYDAHAGDICLYDVAEAQKIVVTAENWNLTDYPTASYPIIGVVTEDESPLGCVVMSTLLVGTDGTPSGTDTTYKWQNAVHIDWGLTKYTTENTAKTDFKGKTNTVTAIAAIKAYDLANSTDNITGNIPDVIQKYAPTGTTAGDWYVPSVGEGYKLYENRSVLLESFNKINSASSSAGLSGSVLLNTNNALWYSTEYNNSDVWYGAISNTYISDRPKYYAGGHKLRPFITI